MGNPLNNIFNTTAEPPIIPPNCTILRVVNIPTVQTAHPALPKRMPGNLLNRFITVSPVSIACFPNSNCTATFIRQLTMITQKAIKPAFAPNMVVAINSPEPTIEADKIKPGPRNFNLLLKETGGSLIVLSVIMYLSVVMVKQNESLAFRCFYVKGKIKE